MAEDKSVFEDVAGEFVKPPESSALAEIFSPDFIARFDPETLVVAMHGVARAIRTQMHPDAITGRSDKEIVELATSSKKVEDLELAARVEAFKQSLRDGAALADEFRTLEEEVTRDPVSAKIGALQKIRNEQGRLPRSRTKRLEEETSLGREEQDLEEETEPIPTIPFERRRQQELLLLPDSLTRISSSYVLAGQIQEPVLYGINLEDEKENPYLSGRGLELMEPSKHVLKSWFPQIEDASQDTTQELITENGGIKLRSDNLFVDASPYFGRTPVAELFDRLNKKSESASYHPASYQLAVLEEDGYKILPTNRGMAYGHVPVDDDGVLKEWATVTFGETPDVLYIVNHGSTREDNRVLYAYRNVDDNEEKIVDGSAVMDETGRHMSAQLLGFLSDMHSYSPTSQNLGGAELTGSDTISEIRRGITLLEEDLDLILRSGLSPDFDPASSLFKRDVAQGARDLGLVMTINQRDDERGENFDELLHTDLIPSQKTDVFAIRQPLAIGVLNTIDHVDQNKRIRDFAAKIKQAAKKVIDAVSVV